MATTNQAKDHLIQNFKSVLGAYHTQKVKPTRDEVIAARYGQASLSDGINNQFKKLGSPIYDAKVGTYVHANTTIAEVKDFKILGNTVNGKSVGDDNLDGTYQLTLVCNNANLITENIFPLALDDSGNEVTGTYNVSDFFNVTEAQQYVVSSNNTKTVANIYYYDSTKTFLGMDLNHDVFTTPANCSYARIMIRETVELPMVQVEIGTVEHDYVENERYSTTIKIPTKLEGTSTKHDELYYDNDRNVFVIKKVVEQGIVNIIPEIIELPLFDMLYIPTFEGTTIVTCEAAVKPSIDIKFPVNIVAGYVTLSELNKRSFNRSTSISGGSLGFDYVSDYLNLRNTIVNNVPVDCYIDNVELHPVVEAHKNVFDFTEVEHSDIDDFNYSPDTTFMSLTLNNNTNATVTMKHLGVAPNTQYTLIGKISKNTLGVSFDLAVDGAGHILNTTTDTNLNIPANTVGIVNFIITTPATLESTDVYTLKVPSQTTGVLEFEYLNLIEGALRQDEIDAFIPRKGFDCIHVNGIYSDKLELSSMSNLVDELVMGNINAAGEEVPSGSDVRSNLIYRYTKAYDTIYTNKSCFMHQYDVNKRLLPTSPQKTVKHTLDTHAVYVRFVIEGTSDTDDFVATFFGKQFDVGYQSKKYITLEYLSDLYYKDDNDPQIISLNEMYRFGIDYNYIHKKDGSYIFNQLFKRDKLTTYTEFDSAIHVFPNFDSADHKYVGFMIDTVELCDFFKNDNFIRCTHLKNTVINNKTVAYTGDDGEFIDKEGQHVYIRVFAERIGIADASTATTAEKIQKLSDWAGSHMVYIMMKTDSNRDRQVINTLDSIAYNKAFTLKSDLSVPLNISFRLHDNKNKMINDLKAYVENISSELKRGRILLEDSIDDQQRLTQQLAEVAMEADKTKADLTATNTALTALTARVTALEGTHTP